MSSFKSRREKVKKSSKRWSNFHYTSNFAFVLHISHIFVVDGSGFRLKVSKLPKNFATLRTLHFRGQPYKSLPSQITRQDYFRPAGPSRFLGRSCQPILQSAFNLPVRWHGMDYFRPALVTFKYNGLQVAYEYEAICPTM
jgi:hypothetical protein